VHQAMVGSAGRLGVFAELTFKVFPRAESRATVRVDAGDLAGALRVLSAMQAARFELEAADIEAPATVWLRLGGFAAAMPSRLDGVQRAAGAPSDRLEGEADVDTWRTAREFSWMPPGAALVRVPLTVGRLAGLDAALELAGARRRYAVGGNVAFITWTESIDRLSATLETVGLTGQVLRGPSGRRLIGTVKPSEFERRVRMVMDPDGRFGGDD
jgi:glycolate oxidase FAD binding subunit